MIAWLYRELGEAAQKGYTLQAEAIKQAGDSMPWIIGKGEWGGGG